MHNGISMMREQYESFRVRSKVCKCMPRSPVSKELENMESSVLSSVTGWAACTDCHLAATGIQKNHLARTEQFGVPK